MQIAEFTRCLNDWGRNQTPFVFIIDFEMVKPRAWRLQDIDENQIWYDFGGISNCKPGKAINVRLNSRPEPFQDYERRFNVVMRKLEWGGSFLTNLTIRTPVSLSHSLEDVFHSSHARYKLLLKNEFLVFSPETFIKTHHGEIFTYPMKGTIDAEIAGAESTILSDIKETSEHVTVVDLLRNDLSMVATGVNVNRFRYLDKVMTTGKNLLQVSSEIKGTLLKQYATDVGDLLLQLLPAGSVSGAPKIETLKVISEAEGRDRGYYTGVCGYFDGHHLDSAVMIRFIEQEGSQYFFRSGGGITTQSVAVNEYKEAIDKIYVPIH